MNHCAQHHRSAAAGVGRRCCVGSAPHRLYAAPGWPKHRRSPAWEAKHSAAGCSTTLLPPARASDSGQWSWDELNSISGNGRYTSGGGEAHGSEAQWQQQGGHWQHGHPDDSWDFVQEGEGDCVPAPSNTPTHEDDDAAAPVFPPPGLGTFDGVSGFDGPLHHHFWAHHMHGGGGGGVGRSARWMVTDRPGLDMRTLGADVVANMGSVFVILFGVGSAHDAEGIYSLRAFGEDGLPQETIIVFESEEDATRYAGLLEAAMDHVPSVCSIPPAELLEFCGDAGYQCRLEPEGSLLIPPDFNVGVTDWERATRLRQGVFAVLDAEPDRHSTSSSSPPAGGWPRAAGPHPSSNQQPAAPHGPLSSVSPARPGGPSSSSMAKYHPSFSDDELADIRNMLESLLPLTGTPASSPAAGGGGGDAAAGGLPHSSAEQAGALPPASGDDRSSKA